MVEQKVQEVTPDGGIGSLADAGSSAIVSAANELIEQVVTWQNVGIVVAIMGATWGLMELVARFPYARHYFNSRVGREMKEWLPMVFAAGFTLMPGVLPDGLSWVWQAMFALTLGGATEWLHIKFKRRFGKRRSSD